LRYEQKAKYRLPKRGVLLIFAPMKMSLPILGLILASILVSSCGGNGKKEGSFTNEELGWLVYNDGDNVLFQNPDSAGDEVTLFISGQKDPAQLRNYYPIEAEVTGGNPEQGDYFKVYLLKDELEFKRYLKIGEVYRAFDLIEPIQEYKVGDILYKDVYIFKEDSTNAASKINEVYFAKGYGVVQYNTKDGRSYQLLNRKLMDTEK
jgi:hypothetical protein